MPLASHPHQAALAAFIASLADVPWLANAGDPDDAAIVADDLVDAWDGWNSEMVAVRRPELAGHLQTLGKVGQLHAVQA